MSSLKTPYSKKVGWLVISLCVCVRPLKEKI